MIALKNIDEIIKIIRGSKTVEEAKNRLIDRFSFSEEQVKAILDMRLQKLTGMEIEKVEEDYQETKKLIEQLKRLISDKQNLLNEIKRELLDIKNNFGDERRTEIVEGEIGSHFAVVSVMNFTFIGGSMGSVVGEKITRTYERGLEKKSPVIIVSCSGGARMQEGILSLMQMAKTSAAVQRFSQSGELYISILTDPTTAGVMASFASLGDLILAEPNALIGFAGARVIRQTIGEDLPPGFQRSEFLLEHGFIDRVVERKNLQSELIKILDFFKKKVPDELSDLSSSGISDPNAGDE